jgi:hypothetical protein
MLTCCGSRRERPSDRSFDASLVHRFLAAIDPMDLSGADGWE